MHDVSVERHLVNIRRALALAALLSSQLAHASSEWRQDDELLQDAHDALAEIHEQAWRCARELSDALPGEVQNQGVISASSPDDLGIAEME